MADENSISQILSRLKTRQLILLVQLDAERSVLRAAEAANMTQPAASKLLAELEDAFGVKLFERHARGVEPTRYGAIMVRHARAALSEISRAHDEILTLRSGLDGQAAIGTVTNPGTNLVPMALAAFKERSPLVRVTVELDFSKPLVERLLDGKLDMAVARILDRTSAAELNFEMLATEPHSVIARAGHPLAKVQGLVLDDLVQQPWILPPAGSILRARLDFLFVRLGLNLPSNFIETMSLPVITGLLRRTDMVVALPADTVRAHCELGVLTVLPIDLGVQLDAFGIVTRRDHELSPGAKSLLVVLRETAAKLYTPGATNVVS